MDIYESMKAAGATEAQLASKTLKMVEEILTKGNDVVPDTVKASVNNLALSVDRVSQRYDHAQNSMQKMLDTVKDKMEWLNKETDKASAAYERAIRAKDSTITDKDLMEAVKAYRAVLEATKDVFGDVIDKSAMTECIVAAINAGSYVAWRGIMGPKNVDSKEWRR